MSMKILRKNPELRGGGSNSFVKRFLTAYTLSEIVIVMLIISVVVAVTIGITKRKLESTVSYTYYSAYETLKDVSRSLLTDFNPKNEKYQHYKIILMKTYYKQSGYSLQMLMVLTLIRGQLMVLQVMVPEEIVLMV